LLAIYMVVPDGWFHTATLPERLPLVLFLMVVAATDIAFTKQWQRVAMVAILAVLAIVRGAAVERAWVFANERFQPLLAAFRTIPQGSRIYTAIAYKGDFGAQVRLPYYELPGYAAIYRHAFYPHTFATASQNIVIRQPKYVAAPDMPHNYRVDRPKPEPVDNPYDPVRLAFYDYVLVVNPCYWPQLPPPSLTPIVAGPDYTLFHIDR
jgi:hypothetical protein